MPVGLESLLQMKLLVTIFKTYLVEFIKNGGNATSTTRATVGGTGNLAHDGGRVKLNSGNYVRGGSPQIELRRLGNNKFKRKDPENPKERISESYVVSSKKVKF